MPVAVLTDGVEIDCESFDESEGGLYLRAENNDLVAFVPYGHLRYVLADGVELSGPEALA